MRRQPVTTGADNRGISTPVADDWRAHAECRYHDPELWFPIGHGIDAQSQIDEALAVCAICPVKNDCLTWSLETGISHGIWGGVEEDDRQRIRRSRLKRLSRARRAEP